MRERSIVVEGDMALMFATTDIRFADAGQAETRQGIGYTCALVKRDGRWSTLALQRQLRSAT